MNEQNMTDVQMYTGLNVSKQRFYGWKSRGSIPKDMLAPIAKILDVSTEWLLTGEGSKQKEERAIQKNTGEEFLMSPDEIALVLKYRKLQEEQKTATQTMLDAMEQPKEMKKAG